MHGNGRSDVIGLGFRIDQAKGLFFDSEAVLAATTRAERRVLSRFGSFVRRRAKSSIRKRKSVSEPDHPPSSHTGLLRKFIWFFFEPERRSVVIGPARLGTKFGSAPELLEHGGRGPIAARWSRKRGRQRTRVVHIRRRPFMQPAFEEEQKQLPKLWANSIR